MLQPPITHPRYSFSFNQAPSTPCSPKSKIVENYIKSRQLNLIEFVRSKNNSQANSKATSRQGSRPRSRPGSNSNMQIDLIQYTKLRENSIKITNQMPSPINVVGHFLSSQRSLSDTINVVQNQGSVDDTLIDEIMDFQKQMDQPKRHSQIRKSITDRGETKINQYTIQSELGRGSFGKVKLANDGQQSYAIKICDRKKLKLRLLSSKIDAYLLLDREIAIMKKVQHKNIVKLHEVIENTNNDKLYLVLEYMNGESLNHQRLNIEIVWKLFRDLILGIDFMHNYANVAHMDIKPDNLLLNDLRDLKIADFGLSQIMDEDIVSSKMGTSAYQPPEIYASTDLKGKPVDIWAAGITLYELIYGKHPFYDKNPEKLKQNVLKNTIEWKQSSDLVDLLGKMLIKDPSKRITASEILAHPWTTKRDMYPISNDITTQLQVNLKDIQNAITKLSFSMAIKAVNKMRQSLNRSRQRIKIRDSIV